MAKVYGMPGSYPAAQAGKLSDRYLIPLLAALVAIGFGLGYAAANWGIWARVIAGLIIVAAVAVTLMRLDRHFVAINRERRAYIRGANGEALIGVLLNQLPGGWHVFHGLQLEDNEDLDHVAVGPAGLFLFSTKAFRGHFAQGDSGELLYNGRRSSLAHQTVAQAMKLKDRLIALMGTSDLYVHAVLAVPLAWVDVRNPHQNAYILHMDNLLDTLESMPMRLSKQQVRAYAEALELLGRTGRSLRRSAANARFENR